MTLPTIALLSAQAWGASVSADAFAVRLPGAAGCVAGAPAVVDLSGAQVVVVGRVVGPTDPDALVRDARGAETLAVLVAALTAAHGDQRRAVAAGCMDRTTLAVTLPPAEGDAARRSRWQAVALHSAEAAGFGRVAVVEEMVERAWTVQWWDLPVAPGLAGLVAPADAPADAPAPPPSGGDAMEGPSTEPLVASGQLVPVDLARQVHGQAREALGQCLSAARRRAPGAAGSVDLVVSFGEDGEAASVAVGRSSVSEPGLEACARVAVAEAAAALQLEGGQALELTVEFQP